MSLGLLIIMSQEKNYCGTINKTAYGDLNVIKWDVYDSNKSKILNNNEMHINLQSCACNAFYHIWQICKRKLKPDFITFVTNWQALIAQVYDRTEKEKDGCVIYFKEIFHPYNYMVINVFDTEMIDYFYSN